LAGGVLNSYQRFAMPALSSTLLNVIGIVVAAFIAPRTANPGLTLAIGVFVAGVAQLAFLIPPLAALGLIRRPHWNWRHEGVKRIGGLMLPAILGSSMGQLGLVLNSVIASFLVTGSIAWLNWADRLVEFPLGVFSIALATVILPSLSSHHAEASPERFSATLDWAMRLVCLIVVPASVALFALAGPLTVVIFNYGAFVDTDVYMTTYALRAFSFALFGWSCIKVLAPGYFARQDTRTPMRTALQCLALNMGLNVVYVVVLVALVSRAVQAAGLPSGGWLESPWGPSAGGRRSDGHIPLLGGGTPGDLAGARGDGAGPGTGWVRGRGRGGLLCVVVAARRPGP
jgi:putative peptidoglycan lipid II flippase